MTMNPSSTSTSGAVPSISSLLPKSLSRELNSGHLQLIPHSNSIDPQTIKAQGKYQVDQDTLTPKVVHVRCFIGKQFTSTMHTALICNTMKDIFIDDMGNDDDAVRLYVQALAHVVGGRTLRTHVVTSALEQAGYTLVLDEINQDDPMAIAVLNQDEETQACKQLVGLTEVNNPHIVMLAYCGSIILLAGKQLNDISAEPWTRRRVKGLSASMGTVIDMSRVASFNTNTALKVYQKLSLLVPLKSTMVRLLFGLAKQGSVTGNLAGAMLNLLSWSEMNHIKMVQEYIFERFPELLAMKLLQGSSLGVLKESWDYLNSLPDYERPFAKLLYGPMQTKSLQRERFVLLIDAAHAVGAYLHSSFKNYQGDTEGSAGQAIKKTVNEYLTKLSNAGLLFAQSATIATTQHTILDNIQRGDDLFNQMNTAMDVQVADMVRS